MIRFFAVVLALCVLLIMSSVVSATNIKIGLTDLSIGSLPEEIRNVPIHPDDYWGKPGPIARDGYKVLYNFSVGVPVARSQDRKLSLNVNWIVSKSTMAERNYTNAPGTDTRGIGAALTYVVIRQSGLINPNTHTGLNDILNFTPEVSYEKSLGRDSAVIFTVSYSTLIAETGWDRYDQLEPNNSFTLATCFPIGIRYKTRNIELGVEYLLMKKSGLGAKSDISGGLAIMAGSSF